MPFDYLKGALGGSKKPQDDAPTKAPKAKSKGLGLLGFAAGTKALTPPENQKNGGKSAPLKRPDKRSLGAKVDDYLGLGSRLQTKEWCQRKWREAAEEIEFQGIDGMLEKYRGPMMAYLETEYSTENGNALIALKAGMPMQDFYARFMDPNAEEEINISKQNVYREYAAKGEFHKFDVAAIRKGIVENLTDTFHRMKFDPDVLKAVFQRLTNMTPPEVVGGGYRDRNDE